MKTKMNQIYTGIILYCIAAILHIVGFCKLKRSKTDTHPPTQRLCLLFLPLSEVAVCLSGIVSRLLRLSYPTCSCLSYITLWKYGLVDSLYISVMIVLTFDRFIAVHLNIKYHLYWCTKRMCMVFILLFLIAAIAASVLTFYPRTWAGKMQVFYVFMWPVYDCTYIFITILTYSYLFYKVKINRSRERKTLQELSSNHNSTVERVKKSQQQQRKLWKGFFLPTLLIVSFLCFWALPDLIFCIFEWLGQSISEEFSMYLFMLYPVGVNVDAICYLLYPLIRVCKRRNNSGIKKIRLTSKGCIVPMEQNTTVNTVISN